MMSRGAAYLLSFLCAATAMAQAQPEFVPPPFPTTAPVVANVVVEDFYAFVRRDYAPPVKVSTIARTATYSTPEAVVIAQISAMKTKNYEWFMALFDETSRAEMDRSDREQNRTPAFWIGNWEEAFSNRTPELVSRVDSDNFVVIAYRLVSANAAEEPIDLEAVAVRARDGWVLTLSKADDPVQINWRTPDERLQRVARQPNPRAILP